MSGFAFQKLNGGTTTANRQLDELKEINKDLDDVIENLEHVAEASARPEIWKLARMFYPSAVLEPVEWSILVRMDEENAPYDFDLGGKLWYGTLQVQMRKEDFKDRSKAMAFFGVHLDGRQQAEFRHMHYKNSHGYYPSLNEAWTGPFDGLSAWNGAVSGMVCVEFQGFAVGAAGAPPPPFVPPVPPEPHSLSLYYKFDSKNGVSHATLVFSNLSEVLLQDSGNAFPPDAAELRLYSKYGSPMPFVLVYKNQQYQSEFFSGYSRLVLPEPPSADGSMIVGHDAMHNYLYLTGLDTTGVVKAVAVRSSGAQEVELQEGQNNLAPDVFELRVYCSAGYQSNGHFYVMWNGEHHSSEWTGSYWRAIVPQGPLMEDSLMSILDPGDSGDSGGGFPPMMP